jgi:hypothetical protein
VNYSKFTFLAIAVLAATTTPLLAQQATDAAKSTPATPSESKTDASTLAPTASSDDAEAAAAAAAIIKANAAAAGKSTDKASDDAAFAKKAKSFGWSAEDRHGTTVYCREAPVLGSHFTEKKCARQAQLATVLEQQEFERDQFKQRGCGGNCGSK